MSGRTLVAPALAGIIVSLAVGQLMRFVGPRLGAIDRPGPLKPHRTPVPYLGGYAVAAGIVSGMLVHGWALTWGGVVGLGGALVLGTADDAVGLSARLRLPMMFALGFALPASGVTASAAPGGTAVSWIFAIVVFAASLNAVNMVDGIDGLAAGAAAISALGLSVIARDSGAGGPEAIAVVLAAACLGFVLYNLPPARLFLGDGGAYLVGAALALLVVSSALSGSALLGAVTCMGIFFLDLALALLRRIVARAALTAGDRSHLYDQLQARGLSRWTTLGICLAIHVAIVGAGVRAAELPRGQAAVIVAGVWAIALFWLVLSGSVTMSA